MSFMIDSISDLSSSIFQIPSTADPCVENELKELLVEHLLDEYEHRLVSKGILNLKDLKKLKPEDFETMFPEKPVHARRLASSLLSPISVEQEETKADWEVSKPKSPRVNLKERRITEKSPLPRKKRGTSFQDEQQSSSSVSPPGKRSGGAASLTIKLPPDSPHSSRGSSSPTSSLSSIHSNNSHYDSVSDDSKKTTAHIRFQRAIRRVMLANATIRVWRQGLGRDLMAIVREKNNLVENPEYRAAGRVKKVYMKLNTITSAIEKLVKSYKQRGLQPCFPATQVALFLEHFPGDICHGERLFAALALLDCMDSQEAGDVSDTVGCNGKTKNAKDGFGYWHALDPNRLTPFIHPLLSDLMAAEGAQRDAKVSADYLEVSLHEMTIQLGYLLKSFGGKRSWIKISNAAAAAGNIVLKKEPSFDFQRSFSSGSGRLGSRDSGDGWLSVSPPLSPNDGSPKPMTIDQGIASASNQPPKRSRSFSKSLSGVGSAVIPQFSPSTFSLRKRASTNLDAGEGGDLPPDLSSIGQIGAGGKNSSMRESISAKATGNEEERNARALKRFTTRVATQFVLGAAASSMRCVENAREAVASAESANDGLRVRQWSENSQIRALHILGDIKGVKENFCMPISVIRSYDSPVQKSMGNGHNASPAPSTQVPDITRGKDLADMLYDTLRRCTLLIAKPPSSKANDKLKTNKKEKKAEKEKVMNEDEEDEEEEWLKVAKLVQSTVDNALLKADICLNNARRAHKKAVSLAAAHRKEWSEKLPVLASIPGFREDLTSAYVDPFSGNVDYSDDPDIAPGEVRADISHDFFTPRSVRAPTITQAISAKEKREKLMKESRGGFAKHQGRLNKEVEAVERRAIGWNEASKLIAFLRSLQSVVYVALPPDDVYLNHNLLITKSGVVESGDNEVVQAPSLALESVSAKIRDSLRIGAHENSLQPGSEAEINIDVNTGDLVGFIRKRLEDNGAEDSFEEKSSPRTLARPPSSLKMLNFGAVLSGSSSLDRSKQASSGGSSFSTRDRSNGGTTPTPKRKSMVANTAELLGNIKAAIGLTREEMVSRKVYFQIPTTGIEMGDSVLVVTAPEVTPENGPDSNGYYSPVEAKEVSIAPLDEAPSILKAHHRNRRRTADAYYSLGIMYTGGIGVKFDQKKAVLAWEVAAALGHGQAQNNLGIMYANGDGAKRNDVRAIEMYTKASEQGINSASYNLGNMLATGRGCKKNPAAALARWLNAAREHHLGAHFNAGVMYEKGVGMSKPDPLRAIAHYTAAAEKGHRDANFNLAFMYHHGAEGVAPSNALALRYYARAAALGDHEAEYMLQRLKK